MNNSLNYSYWEYKTFIHRKYDLIIVGSGIVGLSTAISFKKRNPKATVLVLERGTLPNGASTKNAGFACFGSSGELLDDLKKMPAQAVWDTLNMRVKGLQILRKRLGDKNMNYQALGGYEVFDNSLELENSKIHLHELNSKIKELTGLGKTFGVENTTLPGFSPVKELIKNRHEGQLDTGLMMQSLECMARKLGVSLLYNCEVKDLQSVKNGAVLDSSFGALNAGKVVVATNGFAASLLNLKLVLPARAQVLVTKPVKGLALKGAYHYQQGYYYFRNIDSRILLGGGRNLDISGETTMEQGLHPQIQLALEELLFKRLLPGKTVEIELRWSGIMGVGGEKKPVIEELKKNIVAAVRMGGMGVAIGSWVGEEAAQIIS